MLKTNLAPQQIPKKLLQNLVYCNGYLYWMNKKRKRNPLFPVGWVDSSGYLSVGYTEKGKRKSFRAHRIIWSMFNGQIPEGNEIDHLNRIKTDNRIENLRAVTHQQNAFNVSWTKGTSRFRGVYKDKVNNKWRAQICFDNKTLSLGRFKEESEAAAVYNEMAKKLYGNYGKLNTI